MQADTDTHVDTSTDNKGRLKFAAFELIIIQKACVYRRVISAFLLGKFRFNFDTVSIVRLN